MNIDISDTLAHVFKEVNIGSLCLLELRSKNIETADLERQLTALCDRALAAFLCEDMAELHRVAWEGGHFTRRLVQLAFGILSVTVLF